MDYGKNVLVQFVRRDFRTKEVITFDPEGIAEDGSKGVYIHKMVMNDPEPLGVLVALGPNRIGWAYCSYKKFNKKMMLKAAFARAENGSNGAVEFPKNKRAREQYEYFLDRCKRYYK